MSRLAQSRLSQSRLFAMAPRATGRPLSPSTLPGEMLVPVPPRAKALARALPAPSLYVVDALVLGLAYALIRLV